LSAPIEGSETHPAASRCLREPITFERVNPWTEERPKDTGWRELH